MSQKSMTGPGSSTGPVGWISILAWFLVLLMVALLVWVSVQRVGVSFQGNTAAASSGDSPALPQQTKIDVALPEYNPAEDTNFVARAVNFHTIIPEDKKGLVTYYTVEAGDLVTGIAKQFRLKPETILWANYDLLQDNPNNLTIGQQLKNPQC